MQDLVPCVVLSTRSAAHTPISCSLCHLVLTSSASPPLKIQIGSQLTYSQFIKIMGTDPLPSSAKAAPGGGVRGGGPATSKGPFSNYKLNRGAFPPPETDEPGAHQASTSRTSLGGAVKAEPKGGSSSSGGGASAKAPLFRGGATASQEEDSTEVLDRTGKPVQLVQSTSTAAFHADPAGKTFDAPARVPSFYAVIKGECMRVL